MTDSGACTPPVPAAPGRAPNRPGRDHLDLRVGTHGRFKAAMLRALGDQVALAGLTTRDDDEPAIALLDAWAAALDVLAFSTERIGQEGFLRTATERDSVLELARAVGYELRPGVAATTWLSFTMTSTPDGPDVLPIPVGTRVQSVPGPGELPQVFETVEPVDTRVDWNAMPLVSALDHGPAVGDTHVLLAGVTTALNPGDTVLVLGGATPPTWGALRKVRAVSVVDPVPAAPLDPVPLVAGYTDVTLDRALASEVPLAGVAAAGDVPGVVALRQRAALFGWNAAPWEALPVSLRVGELDPTPQSSTGGPVILQQQPHIGIEPVEGMVAGPVSGTQVEHTGSPLGGLLEHDGLQLQPGAGSAGPKLLPGAYANRQSTWANAVFPAGTTVVHLDQPYPAVAAGSWIVFTRSGNGTPVVAVRKVTDVSEEPVTDFALSGRCARLVLGGGDVAGFSPRTATVFCQGEPLAAAPRPQPTTLGPTLTLDVDRGGTALAPGRTIALDGTDPAAPDGPRRAEIATVDAVADLGGGRVRLTLAAPTTASYVLPTARVLGNVAKATHGESRAEVLGSGDATATFATFTLSGNPLTYVSGATASGARTTLAIWINGVRWNEVGTLFGQPPDAQVYTVDRADDGTTTVRFGDGLTGARLPSGQGNVVATYRVGSGRAGELPRGRLSLLITRPLGVQDAVNPVPSDGSDDPEPRDQARLNAPLSVQTLGRIVSRADYEGFARAFAGVAKARADVVWDGEREIVVVTLAGPDGDPAAGETLTNLAAAIEKARQSTVPVVLRPSTEVGFPIVASLAVAADRRFVDVAAAVEAAVAARYAFANLAFAEPVTRGDILATMQAVPGVEGVVLAAPAASVMPRPGRADPNAAGGLAPAELARLTTVTLAEVTA